MAKVSWKSINLMDVSEGMASNPINPGHKFAKRLLNVYNFQRPGALTLRPGYDLKYAEPTDDTITYPAGKNFGVFFDRQADPNGQEIICEIQKGIIKALNDGSGEPIVTDTMPGFWFWVRPYWNGTAWIDGWQWVNQTIITKITEIDATYFSHIKIFGDDTHGLVDDTLIGWTIYNKTKNQFAKVITCKLDSPDMSINITLYDNSWEVNDVVIISRCWIDIDAQTELYLNVEREDVVFHRINHDLRIGFGGQANRPGLMVGYRKKYYQINEIDFTEMHADLLESGALEKFATTEGIILDTAILNYQYGFETSRVTGVTPAGTYYFRMTGEADDYTQQLLVEGSIYVDGTKDIEIYPYVRLGRENPRITRVKIYRSNVDDNLTYYKVREYLVRDNAYSNTYGRITEDGQLIYEINYKELHIDSNAASTTNESDSIGEWEKIEASGINADFTSEELFPVLPSGNISPQNGSHFLNWHKNSGFTTMWLHSPYMIASTQRLKITFYTAFNAGGLAPDGLKLKVSSDDGGVPNPFGDEALVDFIELEVTEVASWTLWEFELNIKGYIKFEMEEFVDEWALGIDAFQVEIVETQGTEIKDDIGYTPTFDMVKGWDQALVSFNGRVYYLNPYIEKRYENYLVVSHIAPPATFMRDVASFSNFRELEKYDSNETIGIELLPNREILILKDSSVTTLSDDGLVGSVREPVYGVDCVSRVSIVNINGLIFWCGKEEIYLLNIGSSLVPKALLKDTIRDLYLAIVDKTKIFGTRNRFNTFRIRINDESAKTEYLLSENGWLEEKKWHFPEVYRGGFNNKLYFMNDGDIYEESVDFSLPEEDTYGMIGGSS